MKNTLREDYIFSGGGEAEGGEAVFEDLAGGGRVWERSTNFGNRHLQEASPSIEYPQKVEKG